MDSREYLSRPALKSTSTRSNTTIPINDLSSFSDIQN
jgi:hypothetical protein